MNPRSRFDLIRLPAFVPAFLLAGTALAGFTNPYVPPYRGAPDTEFSGWESFTSAHMGANYPDDPASTSDDAVIFQTTPGAFLSAGNIYSFSSASTFELHDTVPGDLQQVALQVSTKGTELDYGNVRLQFVDSSGSVQQLRFTSYTQLAYTPSVGVDVESLFEWDLTGLADNVAAFQILFEASTTSLSLDAVLLDVLWSAPLYSTFCTAKTTLVCGPASISASGTPSASAASGFVVSASPTRGCRAGLLLYSDQAPVAGVAFGGPGNGMLCVVAQGLRRAGPIDAGGTSPAVCDGAMAIDMNAFAKLTWSAVGCAPPPGQNSPAGFLNTAGVTVSSQVWGRDSTTTGQVLSDGLQWTVGP
jgi:hypothetical protein